MTRKNLLSDCEAIRRFARASTPGAILDFDGTLAPIVPTPDEADILPACRAALSELTARFPLVAVVSGRAARDVADRVSLPGVVYVGSHGAEYVEDGVVTLARGARAGVHALAQTLAHVRATADVPGLIFEDKTFSASVHFRLADDPDAARRALTAALESAPNVERVETFWGRMVLELRPVAAPNKGDAVARLIAERGLDAALFVGDDTTDADAMRRLKRLPLAACLSVAVLSSETPAALLAVADYTLNGVAEVADLLKRCARFAPPA